MHVVWDPAKARANFRKHAVLFSDVEGALYDPLALTREDETSLSEKRFITIGMDSVNKLVVVVYAYRGEAVRLVFARHATRKERIQYEEGV